MKRCVRCGDEFDAQPAGHIGRPLQYCSTECRRLARVAHRAASRQKGRPTKRPTPATVSIRAHQLRRLVPAASAAMIERLAQFNVSADMTGNPGFVVIGPTQGPQLVGRVYVGAVVASWKEPCIVFPIAWLAEMRAEGARSNA